METTTYAVVQINRYTRAGSKGKLIICPKCNGITTVYHFNWSALVCQTCDEIINKYDWYTIKNPK